LRLLIDTHVLLWWGAAHRDPFDRMLIAQAKVEGLTMVTVDPAFAAYDIQRLPT
jgi:PIN domain nuclease of toxin-antitoxin system